MVRTTAAFHFPSEANPDVAPAIEYLTNSDDMRYKLLCRQMAKDAMEYHYLLYEIEVDELYEMLSIDNAVSHVANEHAKAK